MKDRFIRLLKSDETTISNHDDPVLDPFWIGCILNALKFYLENADSKK